MKMGTGDAVRLVYPGRDWLGEGIFWCNREQVLYWVDIPMPSAIHRLDPASGRHDQWPMPEMVMALAKRADGSLLVASHHGLNFFDPDSGRLTRMATPEADRPGNRSNDGTTDALGRFWFGTMANNLAVDGSSVPMAGNTGALWCVDAALTCSKWDDGIGIGNAAAFSPDGKVFYFADSGAEIIFAWDYDLEAGALSNKRVFSAIEGHGTPDGACVDADGYLWNARWDGGAVIRFAPDGSVDRIVAVPATRVTCCAFGGPALDTLYITTSRLGLTTDELTRQPDAGGVFAVRPGVSGIIRAPFAG